MLTRKKIFYILIIVAVIGIFFGPFNTRKTDAETMSASEVLKSLDPSNLNKINTLKVTRMSGAEVAESFLPSAGVLKVLADVTHAIVWVPAKSIFTIAGMALNKSIDFTISGPFFASLAKGKAVAEGWGLTRDIVNLLLIFILLYIAISTILQVAGYGAKELLLTLIIIAFLVNFSLVITKLIIDASNVLAIGFYNAFPKTTENGQTTIALSEAFKNAFDAGKIINMDKAFQSDAFKELKNLYLIELITFLLGGAIMIIAAFIFFVFSILFLIRMVVLSMLMILAPLAFAAMILPSTKSHASKWWSALFNQAFFAPAALFMLWLSAKLASGGFIKNALGVGDAGLADMLVAFGSDSMNWDNVVKFILNFIIIAIILIASLIVAKQMGAYGASTAMDLGKKAKQKAQGYAGRIGKKYSTKVVGGVAEGLLKAPLVGRIPLVGRSLARVSGLEQARREKQRKDYEKIYSKYSKAGLLALGRDPTMFGAKREAFKNVMKKIEAKEQKDTEKKERKENLDNAIKGGNIMEIMAAIAKTAMATTEAAESAEEAAKGAAEAATSKETKAQPKT